MPEDSVGPEDGGAARIALVDGNKRLGWVALRVFFRLNGHDLRPPADAAVELVTAVADGALRDVPPIADRLKGWLVRLDEQP